MYFGHLSLIADYMTFGGNYRAMNRSGIQGKSSPLQQMSFETSVRFLSEATQHGVCDDLNSPSSRIVMGGVVPTGTGFCNVLVDSEMLLKNLEKSLAQGQVGDEAGSKEAAAETAETCA